ncbi:MAG: tetratricopeptide repeat protein, partial [Candidatus Thorarchaeota archaeon]
YDNALKNIYKSVEIDSRFTDGWYNLGNIYKLRNEFDKAIESYNKATEVNPEFAKAWFFKGITYFDKKDYNDAILCLEKAIKINPNLAQDINPLIKELRKNLDKLNEKLSMYFINR